MTVKMKYLTSTSLLPIAALAGMLTTRAVDVNVYESWDNVNGLLSDPGPVLPLPGSFTYEIDTPGSHFVGLYLDMEIDEPLNTYFNEFGAHNGALLGVGQSWEIDEPFVFGDIFFNFEDSNSLGSFLDNSNGVPSATPDDVAMALGWNFTLNATEKAQIQFVVSETAPTSGFFLSQTDPDSNYSLYFSSSLNITGAPPPPPVPDGGSTLGLMGAGMLSLYLLGRRKSH
jgi:hypothetical protein